MIAVALAAAAPFAMPMLDKWENGGRGPITLPYYDSVGVLTVCSGNTYVPMKRYTPAECKVIDRAMYNEYGTAVLKCTPSIYDKPKTVAAAVVLTVNIGKAGYCRSTVARRFNDGQFFAGCKAFSMWNKAGRVILLGLTRRRTDEMHLCLEGLPL